MNTTGTKCGICMELGLTGMRKVESNPVFTQKCDQSCMGNGFPRCIFHEKVSATTESAATELADRGIQMKETILDRGIQSIKSINYIFAMYSVKILNSYFFLVGGCLMPFIRSENCLSLHFIYISSTAASHTCVCCCGGCCNGNDKV